MNMWMITGMAWQAICSSVLAKIGFIELSPCQQFIAGCFYLIILFIIAAVARPENS